MNITLFDNGFRALMQIENSDSWTGNGTWYLAEDE